LEKESASVHLFDGTNKNQCEKLIYLIYSSIECVKNVPSAFFWLNSITQLTSRVDPPNQFEACLFKLIRYSVLHYPQAALSHVMSIENSAYNSVKFSAIREFCRRDLDLRQRKAFDAIKTAFHSITLGLIDFTYQNPPSENKIRTISVDSLHSRIRHEMRRGKGAVTNLESPAPDSGVAEFQGP
jgi:hypothetical protein